MHGVPAQSSPRRALADKPLLRFITCGSVDDGKSTLIGRLLYDAGLALDDLIETLEKDSKKHGTQGEALDFALLVDGLAAEREQGITIDVAYRYFATDKRKFIVADTPGHEQYTRNMATGASTAELAVLLIDARKGVLSQTRRHAVIVSMLGVRHVALAINKMDLVGYDEATFRRIDAEFRDFARHLRFISIEAIPLVAKDGDNLVHQSAHMPWREGPSLLAYLESVEVDRGALVQPFRYPVQWVNRPSHDFRGFSGFVCGGNVRPGDLVRILPTGRDTTIARVVGGEGDLSAAVAGQSVTLTLTEEIDVSRGDMLVSPASPAKVGDRLKARLLWLVREPLVCDKSYLLKLATRTVPAAVKNVTARVEIETGLAAPLTEPGETLAFNAIGEAEIELAQPIVCDRYLENRETGGFVLIDRVTNETVAVGLVTEAGTAAKSGASFLEASYSSMEGLPQPLAEPVATRRTSFLKSLSWRAFGSVVTFAIVLGFTRDFGLSLAITVTEAAAKVGLYYVHERAWTRRKAATYERAAPPHDVGL